MRAGVTELAFGYPVKLLGGAGAVGQVVMVDKKQPGDVFVDFGFRKVAGFCSCCQESTHTYPLLC